MRIEDLSSEQIEKVNALATDEERLAYLKECGVELDDDLLSEVAGGADQNGDACPNGGNHNWVKTGKRRKRGGWALAIYQSCEYKCTKCGKCKWA